MGKTWGRAVLVALLVGIVAPAAAQAGTLAVSGAPGSRVITYTDTAGQAGQVSFEQQATTLAFSAESPVTSGAGCTTDPTVTRTASCDLTPGDTLLLSMGDGVDVVSGTATMPVLIDGGPGNDVLAGTLGAALLAGGDGDDVLNPSAITGPVDLYGGAGSDAVSYTGASASVTADADGVADDGAAGQTHNVRTDVEGLLGGQGDDHLIGTEGADDLRGNGGADLLEGLGGNDVLFGGAGCGDQIRGGTGNDVARPSVDGGCAVGADIQGGPGRDVVSYDSPSGGAMAPVGVSLDDVADDGVAGSPMVDNVHSDFEELRGGAFDDVLIGGPGEQVVDGAGGDDLVDGGPGADTLRGGDGSDAADYTEHTAAVALSLDGVRNDGALGEGDLIDSGVEHLVGGSGDDELLGDAGDNGLDGGPGADVLRGGPGVDAADYVLRTAPITASLDGAAGDGEAGENDTVAGDVEGLLGGDGDDVLAGGAGDGFLLGGPGADRLTDGGGEDLIDGEAGDDRIEARDGAIDLVFCGDGSDAVQGDAAEEVEEDCESRTLRNATTMPTPTPTLPTPIRPGTPNPRPRLPFVPRPAPTGNGPVADTRAPRVAIFARTGNGLAKTLRRSALTVRIGCDEPCSATAKLTAHAATARSLARRGYKRGTVVARGTSKRGTLEKLALKQTARGKKMLRALRRGTYRLTVVVTDAAGNRTTVRRTVIVRR